MSSEDLPKIPAPPVQPALQEHADMLSQAEIIKVRDHVYVAFGYALANMIMIEGTDGIIIVDTTESGEVALKILKEFRKITTKPIKAIIQTHYHHDHITGTAALLETTGKDRDDVMVIAHSTLYSQVTKATLRWETVTIGAIYQFGSLLEQGTERVCCGIGPFLAPNTKGIPHQIIKPTHTFEKKAKYEIAGIKLKLYHTPGETDDQITVWIPEWKVVMPADNIYKTFPNLYAIRGSPPRDCVKWYTSLDRVRRLNAEHMVPSHTRPVTGAEQIHSIITSYRDAIQFINDQTARYLNNGLEVDDIVERVNLPPCLASHPYLQQFYGMVSWSVRSVASGKIGWFDKNSIGLFPLSFETSTKYLNQLLNMNFECQLDGAEKLLIMAEEVIEMLQNVPGLDNKTVEKKATWSLTLSLQAMELTEVETELYKRGVEDASKSFYFLAGNTINPNARNFFLTKTKQLYRKNLVVIITLKTLLNEIPLWPIEMLMDRLSLSFKAEDVSDQERMALVFDFPDVDQEYSYLMRHRVLEFHDKPKRFPKEVDVKAKMKSTLWKELLMSEKSVDFAIASGELKIKGDSKILERFMSLLDIFKPNVLKTIKTLFEEK